MKKNLGIAVMNFFGIATLIGLIDLLAARFSFAAFTQTISRPGHIAFVAVLGLICRRFLLPPGASQHAGGLMASLPSLTTTNPAGIEEKCLPVFWRIHQG